MKPNFQIQFLLLTPLIFLFTINTAYSQETEFKNSSIRTGIGIGLNQGKREDGVGLVYSIGWQKSFGEKSKFRLNPNMSIGGFSPVIITGLRDQFYKITLLGIFIGCVNGGSGILFWLLPAKKETADDVLKRPDHFHKPVNNF